MFFFFTLIQTSSFVVYQCKAPYCTQLPISITAEDYAQRRATLEIYQD